MGIATTGYEMKNGGAERNLQGQSTTAAVTVNIKATSPTTSRVEVDAKQGTLSWDKDYALRGAHPHRPDGLSRL